MANTNEYDDLYSNSNITNAICKENQERKKMKSKSEGHVPNCDTKPENEEIKEYRLDTDVGTHSEKAILLNTHQDSILS